MIASAMNSVIQERLEMTLRIVVPSLEASLPIPYHTPSARGLFPHTLDTHMYSALLDSLKSPTSFNKTLTSPYASSAR